MKKVIKQSLTEIAIRYLTDFGFEKEKDSATIRHYAEGISNEFERYLGAYHDFKED